MGFTTDSVHAGQKPDEATGAITQPVYLTSTFAQPELGVNKGYEYARVQNPNRKAWEENIATLEKGKYGIAFASGVAAIHSVISLLNPGEHVILTRDIYGGTYRLFNLFAKEKNLELSFVNLSDFKNAEKFLRKNTRMIYVETPSNPLLNLIDLKETAGFAKENNLISVADNTFATPYFQRPLEMGLDVVIHSSSKYLGGHSDLISGVVVTNNKEFEQKLRFVQKAIGAIPSPFDCWLLLRSVKTLALRMERHNGNAMRISEFFKNEFPDFKVYYPGLKEHPQHNLALSQMKGFGGVVSVDFGSVEIAKRFIRNTRIFKLAESLGGVESMLNHSASMSHASVPPEERKALGVTDSLVRISVGIEDVEDLIEDIEQALSFV